MPDRARTGRPSQRRRSRGFSLVEIASISFILALTLGAVIKGQDMIQNARTRAVMAQGDQFRLAVLGFQDRFRALPGDYPRATTSFSGSAFNGNGNGRIEAFASEVPAGAAAEEEVLAFDHLSKSGFIGARYEFNLVNVNTALPANIFGGYLSIAFDSQYGNPAAPPAPKHSLKTGNYIPVTILAEMDRKIDDGNGLRGAMQFSRYAITGEIPASPGAAGACMDGSGNWLAAANPLPVNCAAALLF
jgi:hypothetical protein